MRFLTLIATLLALSIPASSAPSLPRKSPEFKILEPSGKQILLSSFKGKVTVINFFLTTCQHCQQFAQVLSKLYTELGPRGFQAVGVATFNASSAPEVVNFGKRFGVNFPLGHSATREATSAYLDYSVMTMIMVPQVVVIDREGNIRAQTPAEGHSDLRLEPTLRKLVESLLDEGGATTKKAAAKKATK